MRIIGIDLAVKSAHKAVIADETGRFVSKVIEFATDVRDLEQLLIQARRQNDQERVKVVMEPTGMAWFPIAAYFARQPNVVSYLVNTQQVADLRRFYKRHAKSDRIDCRLLARLPLINGENIHELVLPSAQSLACQRGCRQLDRLEEEMTALKNRIRAIDRFVWPGLDELVFRDPQAAATRWFRKHWYQPIQVLTTGEERLRQAWRQSGIDPEDPGEWVSALVSLAGRVLALYGTDSRFVDFEQLQSKVLREQAQLVYLEEVSHTLRLKTVRKLYRHIHPSRNLETIKGVGQDGAAVYASGIDNPARFANHRLFRGWHGLVPDSRQSGGSEAKGLHITKAGPDLIKKYAYLDAEVARQWDPQLAALYYDQMVHKGKHHIQAVCTCATHLLDRVLVVLREDKPYELRDVDGRPVSIKQAREIIAERYQVPKEIRERNNKLHRQQRTQRSAEKNEQKKESRRVE
ncbi:IS110 family RNA-guided transposase [Levilinea saccharolytica]|uniref:IS110 family transposase n=1 Tax=Levilinea saccharolytica TaxID=229921 RepID=UPI0007809052|nr:IS110 family transposase [Levilinea saccharolytica]GAP17325.1 transposase [Levilinea saccharolytica]